MLLGAQLPHQFLNLRRKDFSAPLHSCLGLPFLVTTTPPQLWPPFSSSSGISLPLVYTHISYEFHINFLSNMFASLPLVFVLFLHWLSFHKLIQSFTSAQLNYQTMFWPLMLIFSHFRTRTTVLSSMLMSFPHAGEMFPKFPKRLQKFDSG